MKYRSVILFLLRLILIALVAAWVFAIKKHPVHPEPDSFGFMHDAVNFLVPGYVSQRPPMYPLWLLALGKGSATLSIICFLFNAISLLWLVHFAGNRKFSGWSQLFSLQNTIILIFFFLMSAIWSYCATVLTESILFAVEIWIFILLAKIIDRERPWKPGVTIFYSLLISVLAITLKPWIMLAVILISFLLLAASIILRNFRMHLRSSTLLLTITTLAFAGTYSYSKSKSFESANSVVLIINTPREANNFRERLKDSAVSKEDSVFINDVLSDIHLINTRYEGNPWKASEGKALKVLDVLNKDKMPAIRKAFRMMYFDDWHNIAGLGSLALSRYFIKLKAGLSCLDITYGPRIRLIKNIDFPFIFVLSLICIGYYMKVVRKKAATRINFSATVFAAIVFLSAVVFGIFLTLAGTDLQRVVYTAIPFQLFALVFFVYRFRESTCVHLPVEVK